MRRNETECPLGGKKNEVSSHQKTLRDLSIGDNSGQMPINPRPFAQMLSVYRRSSQPRSVAGLALTTFPCARASAAGPAPWPRTGHSSDVCTSGVAGRNKAFQCNLPIILLAARAGVSLFITQLQFEQTAWHYKRPGASMRLAGCCGPMSQPL